MFWPTSTRTYISLSHAFRRHLMESLKSDALIICSSANWGPYFLWLTHTSLFYQRLASATNVPHFDVPSPRPTSGAAPRGSCVYAIYSPILRLPTDAPRYSFWPEYPRSTNVMPCGLPFISKTYGVRAGSRLRPLLRRPAPRSQSPWTYRSIAKLDRLWLNVRKEEGC